MALLGTFDLTALRQGWFDQTAQATGWFGPDLLPQTSVATIAAGGEAGTSITAQIGDGATISAGGQGGASVTASIGDGATISSGAQGGVTIAGGIGDGATISSGAQGGVAISGYEGIGSTISSGAQGGVSVTASGPTPPPPVAVQTAGDPRSKPKRIGVARQPAWAAVRIIGQDAPARTRLTVHATVHPFKFAAKSKARLRTDGMVFVSSARCAVRVTFATVEPALRRARAAVHARIRYESRLPHRVAAPLHSVRVTAIQNPTDDELLAVYLASI